MGLGGSSMAIVGSGAGFRGFSLTFYILQSDIRC